MVECDEIVIILMQADLFSRRDNLLVWPGMPRCALMLGLERVYFDAR